MTLRITTKARNGKHVAPEAIRTLQKEQDAPVATSTFYSLLYALAYIIDEAAVNDDTCVIFGTTRDRSSFSCSFKIAGQTQTVYGATLADLAENVSASFS